MEVGRGDQSSNKKREKGGLFLLKTNMVTVQGVYIISKVK